MNFSLKAFMNKITPYFSSNWSRSFLWFFEFLLKVFQPTEAATDGVLLKKSVLKKFAKFTWKNLCCSLKTGTPKHVFPVNFGKFYRTLSLSGYLQLRFLCVRKTCKWIKLSTDVFFDIWPGIEFTNKLCFGGLNPRFASF